MGAFNEKEDPMNKDAVTAIDRYISEYLFEPFWNWPPYWFEERSYSRWAANEILERVKNSQEPPTEVIKDFIRTLDKLSDTDGSSRRIFMTAKEEAECILRLFT